MKAIIYLFGPAGSGKYTIAKRLVALRPSLKLIHNHHINNVIFEIVNADGKTRLPGYVWQNVNKVRDAVLDTVRTTDRNEGYIFTNVLTEGRELDASVYADIRSIASEKNLTFCPVRLTITIDELCQRIQSPQRREMIKDISPENALRYMQNCTVFTPKNDDYLELDVTDRSVEQSAEFILKWATAKRQD